MIVIPPKTSLPKINPPVNVNKIRASNSNNSSNLRVSKHRHQIKIRFFLCFKQCYSTNTTTTATATPTTRSTSTRTRTIKQQPINQSINHFNIKTNNNSKIQYTNTVLQYVSCSVDFYLASVGSRQ
jgi:hypothetical protein